MRIILVIVALAAIGVGIVHVRRGQTRSHHEIQRLQMRQVQLRRQLYDQQAALGRLTMPRDVLRRTDRMGIPLVERQPPSPALAEGSREPGR